MTVMACIYTSTITEVILVEDNQLESSYVSVITQIKGEVMAGACLGVNEQNTGLLDRTEYTLTVRATGWAASCEFTLKDF